MDIMWELVSMVRVFRFEGRPGEDYWEVLDYIDEHGQVYVSERGQKYKEAEPIIIEVENPIWGMPSEVLPEYVVQRWGEMFILEYASRVAWCKPEPGDWSYSYGERLAMNKQVDKAIEKLKKWKWTRQATCVLYLPQDLDMVEPPCMCLVDFKIRDGLRTTTIFRSNDMENGWPSNYYDLLILSKRVADELNIDIRRITTFSISAHKYLWRIDG